MLQGSGDSEGERESDDREQDGAEGGAGGRGGAFDSSGKHDGPSRTPREGGGGSGDDRTEGGSDGKCRAEENHFHLLHKKAREEGPQSFRLSQKTLDSKEYPRYDNENLGRFGTTTEDLGKLAFAFFSIMFPAAVVALLVKEVSDPLESHPEFYHVDKRLPPFLNFPCCVVLSVCFFVWKYKRQRGSQTF